MDAKPIDLSPATGPATGLDQARRGAGLLLTLLMLANAVSFMDRFVFVLLLEPIRQSLNLTDTAVSVLQGLAFMLFYLIAAIPIGALTDRSRRVSIVAIGVLGWSAATLCCGLARNYAQLFLARMGVGLGEAALTPAAVSMISDVYPRRAWGRAVSIFSAGSTLGPAFAYAFGGYIYGRLPPAGVVVPVFGVLAPWQIVFMMAAIPGAVLGLVFLLFVKEPARARSMPKASATPLKTVGSALFKDPGLIRLLCAFGLMSAASAAVMAWAPALFIRVHHWSVKDVGLAFGAMNLACGFIGISSGGFLSDLLRGRGVKAPSLAVIMVGLIVVAPSVAAFALNADATAAFAWLALATFFSNMCVGAAVPTIPTVTRPEVRSTVVAFYIMLANLCGIGLAPTGVALVNALVFKSPMALGKAVALFVAICLPIAWLILLMSRRWVIRVSAERAAQDALAPTTVS